jgi:hypothetical protein
VHEVEGYSVLQVLDLLGEGVRQSGKAPRAHAHRQTLALATEALVRLIA